MISRTLPPRTEPFPWDERDEWVIKIIAGVGLPIIFGGLILLVISDTLSKIH